jgi:hypothetical protein
MTRREARYLGREPGFVLTVEGRTQTNFPVYLSDYRARDYRGSITTEIDRAEWFGRLIDAAEMSERLSHLTGDVYTPLAEPGLERPRCCGQCKPLLTADDAFREAFTTAFSTDDDDDAECGEAIRTEWGTITPKFASDMP